MDINETHKKKKQELGSFEWSGACLGKIWCHGVFEDELLSNVAVFYLSYTLFTLVLKDNVI